MALAGDTLLTYDPLLSHRVSVWLPDGRLIRTIRLPTYRSQPTHFVTSSSSSSRLIVGALDRATGGPRRLYETYATLLVYDGDAESFDILERRRWTYEYIFPQRFGPGSVGVTYYGLPFFGRTHVVAIGDQIAVVPLDSAVVQLWSLDSGYRRIVPLGVPRRPFDRGVIERYRDSLLAIARGSAAARIRATFGPDLPTPPYSPAAFAARRIGEEVWIQTGFEASRGTRWHVLDPGAGRVSALCGVPPGEDLLGGNGRSVVLRTGNELGVEMVVVRDVLREG